MSEYKIKAGRIGLPAGEKVKIVSVASGFQWGSPILKNYIVEDSRGNRHKVVGHNLKK